MNLKKIKIRNFPLTLFQKNVIAMFKGTFFAQFFSLVGGLLLAKFYGSDKYALYGVFISATSIFAIINTLQLEYSIVLSSNDKEKNQIVSFTIILIGFISLINLILFYFIYTFNYSLQNENIFLAIIGAFLLSIIKVFEYSLISKNSFTKLSFSNIITSFFTVVFQFMFIYISFEKGLIYGYITSSALVLLYLLKINLTDITKINFNEIKAALKKNNTLLKYAFPSNLINTIANNSMPILILVYFSTSESGAYFLSIKLLSAPLLFISNTISKPYFNKATELYKNKDKNLLRFTKKIAYTNLVIMLLFVIVLNIFNYFFLDYFFDEKWVYLIEYSFFLSFLFLGKSIFSPISHIVEILNKNHIGLLFNIYLVVATFFAIYFGHIYSNSLYSVIFMSIVNGVAYFFIYFYFLFLIKTKL